MLKFNVNLLNRLLRKRGGAYRKSFLSSRFSSFSFVRDYRGYLEFGVASNEPRADG